MSEKVPVAANFIDAITIAHAKEKKVYKTQKAQGIGSCWALSRMSGYGYSVAPVLAVLPYSTEDKVREIFEIAKESERKVFVRPCPVVPRHGFVESREVSDYNEVMKVWKETITEDPDGELIIMNKLSGKYSAVMTAAGVTWGMSHNGVTAGYGRSYIIPTPVGNFDSKLLQQMGRDPNGNEGVYCELVENYGGVWAVQMRLGPKQPDSRVKRHTAMLRPTIRRVLTPESSDLIDWSLELAKVPAVETRYALAWLPGQTMSSHFAVQAIAAGFNVSVEDKCPAGLGQVLEADVNEMRPLTEDDYKFMAQCIRADRRVLFMDGPRNVLLSVAILHSVSYWGSEPHLLALRARGIVIAARYAFAACLGEARHSRSEKKKTKIDWKFFSRRVERDLSRGTVFNWALKLSWGRLPTFAGAAAEDMVWPNQPNVMEHLGKGGKLSDYPSNYMGMKWEFAALKVRDLIKSINMFCQKPSADRWNVALGLYNEIINAAHNGGYLMNKWASTDLIDHIASSPSLAFGYSNVMEVVWGKTVHKREGWDTGPEAPLEGHSKSRAGVMIPNEVIKEMSMACDCLSCILDKAKELVDCCVKNHVKLWVPLEFAPAFEDALIKTRTPKEVGIVCLSCHKTFDGTKVDGLQCMSCLQEQFKAEFKVGKVEEGVICEECLEEHDDEEENNE